jgi:cellulose synthase/poly-beta-1,6-N-acetylglucosamine synthase-like glycosyltransferase
MEPLAVVLFWTVLGAFAYAYLGFPLLTIAVGAVCNRRVRTDEITPAITVVVAAFNEERSIADRIDNILAADYPDNYREIIIASDGSTDATEAIVDGYTDRRVRLLRLPRQGKIPALDAAVRRARGDVIVFSDANTVFHDDALRAIARNFADSEVGGVVGHTYYRLPSTAGAAAWGEHLYWQYDTWLKQLESGTGSVVSAHGGLYAIRRDLYQTPAESSVTDDFAISTAVVAQGRRLVFEPDALAFEPPAPSNGDEFSRRVRLMTRGMRSVALRKELLDPATHGYYAVALFSRKVLRRLLPLGLPPLLVSSAVLAPSAPLYAAALALQLVFYSLAAVGLATRNSTVGRQRIVYVPMFFCMANAAALVALWRFLRGDRISSWQPARVASAGG